MKLFLLSAAIALFLSLCVHSSPFQQEYGQEAEVIKKQPEQDQRLWFKGEAHEDDYDKYYHHREEKDITTWTPEHVYPHILPTCPVDANSIDITCGGTDENTSVSVGAALLFNTATSLFLKNRCMYHAVAINSAVALNPADVSLPYYFSKYFISVKSSDLATFRNACNMGNTLLFCRKYTTETSPDSFNSNNCS